MEARARLNRLLDRVLHPWLHHPHADAGALRVRLDAGDAEPEAARALPRRRVPSSSLWLQRPLEGSVMRGGVVSKHGRKLPRGGTGGRRLETPPPRPRHSVSIPRIP